VHNIQGQKGGYGEPWGQIRPGGEGNARVATHGRNVKEKISSLPLVGGGEVAGGCVWLGSRGESWGPPKGGLANSSDQRNTEEQ